jgi:hypothetical protein
VKGFSPARFEAAGKEKNLFLGWCWKRALLHYGVCEKKDLYLRSALCPLGDAIL